jgi:formimidoylglutamate deiminase
MGRRRDAHARGGGIEGFGRAARGGPVLPGMPNVHSHAFQRAMAGLAEWRGHPTDDFWTWREAMYDLVRRWSPKTCRPSPRTSTSRC